MSRDMVGWWTGGVGPSLRDKRARSKQDTHTLLMTQVVKLKGENKTQATPKLRKGIFMLKNNLTES